MNTDRTTTWDSTADARFIEEQRTKSFTPDPLVPPAMAGKKTLALYAGFNARQLSFANIGARLGQAAKAYADAKTAYSENPTDENLDRLASAKNANEVLISTGVKNDPAFFDDLRREQFETAELFSALQTDCETLAARFAKSAAAARKAFADALHAKILNGENAGYYHEPTPLGQKAAQAFALMDRLEKRRDYLTEQAAGAGGLATGHPHLHANLSTILQSLTTDPEAFVAGI